MAFEILVGLNITDEEIYKSYRKKMMPILSSYGGGFGYDFKISEVLESRTKAPINRVFIIYFPDKESMNLFFLNKEYLEIKQIHFENSVSNTTIIASYEQP
jgi:uncharacterized protein (DUF1330 family)